MNLRLDWCTHEAAKYAVIRWHYSRTMPVAKSVYIGAWEDGQFIGVIIFSMGRGAACDGTKYGLAKSLQMAELQRVALTKHKTPVTRMLAIAISMLREKCPGIRMLISFADSSQGHHGGIYQGGNWIFTGISAQGLEFLLSDGRWVHSRDRNDHFGRGKSLAGKLPIVDKRKTAGKYRYLMPLDAEMRARILPLAKPYPKRAKRQDAGDHPALDGSVPIRALQTPETMA